MRLFFGLLLAPFEQIGKYLMNEADHLAEILRVTASDLLRLTKNINDAYRRYAEYVTQQEIEAATDYLPEEEVEVEEPFELEQQNLWCMNCSAPIEANTMHCPVCGEEYE